MRRVFVTQLWSLLALFLCLFFEVKGLAQNPNFDADKFLEQSIKMRKGQKIDASNAQKIYNEDFERALREMMPKGMSGTNGISAEEEAFRKEIENAPRLLKEAQQQPLKLADDMWVDGSDLVSISGFFLRDVRTGTGDPPEREPSVFGTAVYGEYTFATATFRVSQTVSNQQIAFVPFAWDLDVRGIYGAEKQKERMRVLAGEAVGRLVAFSEGGDPFIPYSQFFPAEQKRLHRYIKGVFSSKGWRGWHYDPKKGQNVIDGTITDTTYWAEVSELCYRFQAFPTVTNVNPFGLTLPKERDFCLEGAALEKVTSITLGGVTLQIVSQSSTKVSASIPSSFQGGMVLDENALSNSGAEMLKKSIVPLKVMAGSSEVMFMGFTPPFKGLMVFRDPDASADLADSPKPIAPDLPSKEKLHTVSGRLFYDKNASGKLDAGEASAPFGGLKVTLWVLQTPHDVVLDSNTGVYRLGAPLETWWEKVEESVTSGDGAYRLTKAVHGKQCKITMEIPPNHIATWGKTGFFKQDVSSTESYGPFEVDQDLSGIDLGILQVPRVLGLQFEDGTTSAKLTEGNAGQTIEKGLLERLAGNVLKIRAELDIPWHESVSIGMTCVKFQQWPQSSPSYWSQAVDDFSLYSSWLSIRPGEVAGTNQFFTLADDLYEADEPVWIILAPELCSAPLVFPKEDAQQALKLVIVNDDVDIVWASVAGPTPPNATRNPGTYFMGPPYLWRLPDAHLDRPYRVEFMSVGPVNGTPRWDLLHGAGLDGMEFDTKTGILSGTPKSLGDFGGDFMFSISLDGNDYQHTEKWFFIKIIGTNAPTRPLPPKIIRQPSSTKATSDSKASLSADAIGSEPTSYQWQRAIEVPGQDPATFKWEDVANRNGIWGAKTSVLRFDSFDSEQAGLYRLIVKNAGGETFSQPARISLFSPRLNPSPPLTPAASNTQSTKNETVGEPSNRTSATSGSAARSPGLPDQSYDSGISGQATNTLADQAGTHLSPNGPRTNNLGPEASHPASRLAANHPSQSASPSVTKLSEPPGNPHPDNLAWIPSGIFLLGSPDNESGRFKDEGPQQEVRFSRGFWMAKTEVNQSGYEDIVGANPSTFRNEAEAPVETVTYAEAQTYCRKLSDRDRASGRLPKGYTYRLPTEAEWEYACRAGSTTAYSSAGDSKDLEAFCWHRANTGGTEKGSPRPVGKLQPNAWGIFDMHGNVAEWVLDSFHPYAATAPGIPLPDPSRLVRGGSWADDASLCRSAARKAADPVERSPYVGFRVVLAPEQ
jgi:formylglycine-generating enzyme required for sulfatase activity